METAAMPLDLSRWLRTFLAPDDGASSGGVALADAVGGDDGGADVGMEDGPFDAESAAAEGGSGESAPVVTSQPSAKQAAAIADDAAGQVDDTEEAFNPAEVIASLPPALVKKARDFGLADDRIAEYGDYLPYALQDMEGLIVQQVLQEQNKQPPVEPQKQAPVQPPVQPAQPQGSVKAPATGALVFDPVAKAAATAEKFVRAGINPDDAKLFGDAMVEVVQPIMEQMQELVAFRQRAIDAEEARNLDAVLAEFNGAVEGVDAELFGKGPVADGTPQLAARQEVWTYAMALFKGLAQQGRPVPPMAELVQSAYAAKYGSRIAKKAQAEIIGKAKGQKHGVRPPRRQTHQPHTPTPEQRAMANISKRTGLPMEVDIGPPDLPE